MSFRVREALFLGLVGWQTAYIAWEAIKRSEEALLTFPLRLGIKTFGRD